MKKTIAVLAAAAVLALTGCSTSPSVDDQARARADKRISDNITVLHEWNSMPFEKKSDLCMTWRGRTALEFAYDYNNKPVRATPLDPDAIIEHFQRFCGNPATR